MLLESYPLLRYFPLPGLADLVEQTKSLFREISTFLVKLFKTFINIILTHFFKNMWHSNCPSSRSLISIYRESMDIEFKIKSSENAMWELTNSCISWTLNQTEQHRSFHFFRFTEKNLKWFISDLYVAGLETLSTGFLITVRYLLAYPEYQGESLEIHFLHYSFIFKLRYYIQRSEQIWSNPDWEHKDQSHHKRVYTWMLETDPTRSIR